MAVIDNTVTAIGDILYIFSQAAIDGDVEITGFTDIIAGETSDRFFVKEFRYSTDAVNYSNWKELNDLNLQNINGKVRGLLFLEYKYTRSGSDNTGTLIFENITINGDIILQICNNTATMDSIFEDLYCNDFYTTAVRNNLLRKIYHHGIVPKFIERGEGIDDTDYIAFWGSVCLFLAFVSSFSNNFEFIFFKRELLVEYLYQQGLRFCRKEIQLQDLQYLTSRLFEEIRKRGTQLTYKKKHAELLDGNFTQTDGEWLRILCRNPYDEFLLDVIDKTKHGHCIGQSSPMYNGTLSSNQINKTKENSPDFQDEENFIITGNPTIDGDPDSDRDCLKISTVEYSGIGYDINNPPNIAEISDLIVVDSEIDYEVVFDIKRLSGDGDFIFGIHGFNRNGAYKPLSFYSTLDNQISNIMLSESTQDLTKIANEWYTIRGIIYAKNSDPISNEFATLNNNRGNSLRFNHSEQIERISVFLQASNADILIHNFKVRPLIRGKNILRRTINPVGTRPVSQVLEPYVKNPQFLQGINQALNWRRNNNDEMTDMEVDNFIQEYLLPYQQRINSIPITPKIDDKQILT